MKFFNWLYVYFVFPLEYLIKKLPEPAKRATITAIKVKSCNALLRILLVCVSIYQKSVMRYKFLILDTYHQDTIFTRARM